MQFAIGSIKEYQQWPGFWAAEVGKWCEMEFAEIKMRPL
jgi:hypothetical protein